MFVSVLRIYVVVCFYVCLDLCKCIRGVEMYVLV